MNRSLVIVPALVVAGLASSSTVELAGQQNQPGFPTLAQVHVLNRNRADAVPVMVLSGGDMLPVTVVGEPTVALSKTAVVATRPVRQAWEYRQLSVPASQDPAGALNTAGGDGWEALGPVVVGSNVVWTLKRPR